MEAIGAKATAAVTNIAMRILFTIFTSFEIRPTRDKRDKRKIAKRAYTYRAGRIIRETRKVPRRGSEKVDRLWTVNLLQLFVCERRQRRAE